MKRNAMDWLTRLGGRLLTLGRPDDVPLERSIDLQQSDETWECTVRRARTWITPPDQDPYRPWIILVISQDGRVLGTDLTEDEPTVSEVINALAMAMRHPAPGAGRKRRPSVIHTDDAAFAKALAPRLAEIGIACRFRRPLREADEALQSLEQFLGREDRIPGLLEAPGITPFMIEGLFEAAAYFYHQAPWRWIDDSQPIEMRYPVDSQPRYAVVMGHGGETYGLAIYNSTDVLEETYAGTPPDQLIGREAWTALLFGEAIETPFDDLDAIEAHDWPVADKYAYPLVVQAGLSRRPTRPGKSDLLRLEAALLALPRFVGEHMRADVERLQPAEATLVIAMADGEDRILLRYPVPGFEMSYEDQSTLAAARDEARDQNAELLSTFEQWLRNQGLSPRTVQTHMENIKRFAQQYLAGEGGALGIPCPAIEADLADVDVFLADWLLYQVDQAPVATVKSHIASLKKLYVCLKETRQMPAQDSAEILALLREDREYYIELAREVEEEPPGR
jgi:hypothetical protein